MHVRLQQNGEKVLLVVDGQRRADLHWDQAIEIGRGLIAQGNAFLQDVDLGVISDVGYSIRRDNMTVILAVERQCVLHLEWQSAVGIGHGLMAQGHKAEEIAKHEQIIADEAFVLRSGLGNIVGLTNHPYLQKEAAKEAAWNSELRRWLPGGVKSEIQIGVGRLVKRPVKKEKKHDE